MRHLVTGGAGFIGSNIVEALLARGDEVVVLDDLSTGRPANIEPFLGDDRFTFIDGTIADRGTCDRACAGVSYVFHEAALVSVPQSVDEPEKTWLTNIGGTSNVFLAARDAGVTRVVWASSTAVYGNAETLPNVETMPLKPLSPYAASKASGEMLASAYSDAYDMSIVSLRYYNVFGKRQDPASQYAAAIPIFVTKFLHGETPIIYGDGEQTRDFVHIDNVVQANLRAAFDALPEASGRAFNIGCGERVSINGLCGLIAEMLGSDIEPAHGPDRPGDVRHSVADIGGAKAAFGYEPSVDLRRGLQRSIEWYRELTV